ncbi:hypothetical protein GALMADRAFT_1232238 [Galerina marginata CBS 339.88]|uniref:Uncharacterized protein n=1 Tax=Galerina marginata (strain CBS 339.88) TaxID=685588 RepID=A0A067TJY6_GALM3|nr:hypothetical protein GALMADRAFT_1232238 [Galerina marginata CBS 339.88]
MAVSDFSLVMTSWSSIPVVVCRSFAPSRVHLSPNSLLWSHLMWQKRRAASFECPYFSLDLKDHTFFLKKKGSYMPSNGLQDKFILFPFLARFGS